MRNINVKISVAANMSISPSLNGAGAFIFNTGGAAEIVKVVALFIL